jgi:hypothetical protein
MSSEHSTFDRHAAPGIRPGPPGAGHHTPPGGATASHRGRSIIHGVDATHAWHDPHPAPGSAAGAAPPAADEYLLRLTGRPAEDPPVSAQAAGSQAAGTGRSTHRPGPPGPAAAGHGDGAGLLPPTAAQANALIAASSLGTPGVADIAARTSDDDIADVLQRMHTLRRPPAEPPAEYSFESWIEQSHDLPHALMRVGRSYARQHFHHRAELCFRAALSAGHPEAADALASLPRTHDGLIAAGSAPETALGHPDPTPSHEPAPTEQAAATRPDRPALRARAADGPPPAQPAPAPGRAGSLAAQSAPAAALPAGHPPPGTGP